MGFESVANTTNESSKQLLLVHGATWRRSTYNTGGNNYNTGTTSHDYTSQPRSNDDHDSTADRRRKQGNEYNIEPTVEYVENEDEDEDDNYSWIGGLVVLVCLGFCIFGAWKCFCGSGDK